MRGPYKDKDRNVKTDIDVKEMVQVPGTPDVPGLSFRRFRGEGDYPLMLAAISGSKEADGIERTDTLEDIRRNYAHLNNCDPYQDMLFAEVDGQVVGYGRVWWEEETITGEFIYDTIGFVLPAWRRKGIGGAMLRHNEKRVREIGRQHPAEAVKKLQVWASDSETSALALYERFGYQPVRYGFEMVRPLDRPVEVTPMPEGLELRPVKPEHYRLLWEADQEAFRDHWGFVPGTEEDYRRWQEEPTFNPELWKVAFDGEQVAGMVLNFLNEAENKEYNRQRGYTENIAVRRPWRKRGLARSLLTQSLKMFQDMGMAHATLGVDAENPNGALRLYQSVGFEEVKRFITLRKQFP